SITSSSGPGARSNVPSMSVVAACTTLSPRRTSMRTPGSGRPVWSTTTHRVGGALVCADTRAITMTSDRIVEPRCRIVSLSTDERVCRIGGKAIGFWNTEFPAHHVGSAHESDAFVKGMTAAHAFTAHAAVGGDGEAFGRQILESL